MPGRRDSISKRNIASDIRRMRKGDKRLIAQLISFVENARTTEKQEQLFRYTGSAYHVGVTGPPGAGKSTLVNAIAKSLLGQSKKLGIIAVDPTSPFSGGALLGDRVRMTDLSLNERVFIRSMASRGSLGGLARKTKDAILVLDAAGMDYILVETIGVGQVELDIAQVCDTTIVVLVPESGDSIQAMKAGLIEIADIMVVNKGDRDGCDRLVTELKFAFELREQEVGWSVPILRTVASKEEGIEPLVNAVQLHRELLEESGRLERRRKEKLLNQIHERIEENVRQHVRQYVIKDAELEKLIHQVYIRKCDPYSIANTITRRILKKG